MLLKCNVKCFCVLVDFLFTVLVFIYRTGVCQLQGEPKGKKKYKSNLIMQNKIVQNKKK